MNAKIINPPNLNMNDIKKEIISTANGFDTIITYPNGFVLRMIHSAE